MGQVTAVPPPDASLLVRWAEAGDYMDCFEVTVDRPVDLPAFLFAFYTTPLFRLERLVLSAKLRRRIADAEARALAQGADTFALWQVLEREAHQILLQDTAWGTRSWLSVEPCDGATVLRFGSRVPARGGVVHPVARAILPLHLIYSRRLLSSAAHRLTSPQE